MGTPFAFLVTAIAFMAIVAAPTEILVEDDVEVPETPANAEQHPERLCHIEYQVMKRTIGRCVKFGRSATGCVSGTYLRPFHPECL